MIIKRHPSFSLFTLVRNCLFQLDPELAHKVTLNFLRTTIRGPLQHYLEKHIPRAPVSVMGLQFPNPVGLAAGFDQHGTYCDALLALGFGFIEIGGVTPKAQEGNPQPRLFRLIPANAIINRMGFPNQGVDYACAQIQKSSHRGILGVNITKNRETPLEQAIDDYVYCMRRVFNHADYVTVNISSPNTPGLRQLQQPEQLRQLLLTLKKTQAELYEQHGKYLPIAVKIAPDLTMEQLRQLADELLEHKVDGVIATNTTVSRPNVEGIRYADEAGGLSGQPLNEISTAIVGQLYELLADNIPIIACGGIMSAMDALEKFKAGARLVQIYTGFVYRGPHLIQEIVSAYIQEILS